VEKNLAKAIVRARRDLQTKDIDACALLNSRVRIVQKVRWFRYRDGIIGEVSFQGNNQLVSQICRHSYSDLAIALSQPGDMYSIFSRY